MSKRTLCLTLLRRAGTEGVTTDDFLQAGCGSRFGARLQELRDSGYDIRSERVRDGQHRYKLSSHTTSLSVSQPSAASPAVGGELEKPTSVAIAAVSETNAGQSIPATTGRHEHTPGGAHTSPLLTPPGGVLFELEERNPIAPDLAA